MATAVRLRNAFVFLGCLGLLAGCQANVASSPRPVAVVGSDLMTNPGKTVQLDGSASHVPGQASAHLSYHWTLVSAPATSTAKVQRDTAPVATLTPQVLGLYLVRLVVSYGGRDSLPAYLDVSAFNVARNPIANAGPDQTVPPGATVHLDGTGSHDPTGSKLTYAWSVLNGPANLNLVGPTTATPSFVAPDPAGVVVIGLQVTDARGLVSNKDQVNITIENLPPMAAISGPTSHADASSVGLTSNGSTDPNGDPITAYAWRIIGSAAGATLSTSDKPTTTVVIPNVCGNGNKVTVGLTVTAGGQTSAEVTHTIDILDTVDNPPTASAGKAQTMDEATALQLKGTASDCNVGDKLTYQWTQVGGPKVTWTTATNILDPTFTSPRIYTQQTLKFTLTVTDSHGETATSSVDITELNTIDEPPVARATTPVSAVVGSKVTLDATASSDPNGDPLTFSWAQTGGTPVTLTGATTATPSFTAPTHPGSITFSVTVNDGKGMSNSTSVRVNVQPGPPDLAKSTITASPTSITANGTDTSTATVTLRDGYGNAVGSGYTVVVSPAPSGIGTMTTASAANTGGGIYTQVFKAGTTAGTATLKFTVSGVGTSTNTATVTLVASKASGPYTLTAKPGTIVVKGLGTDVTKVTSSKITDQNGNAIPSSDLVTVTLGGVCAGGACTFSPPDASGAPNYQVAPSGGVVTFYVHSGLKTVGGATIQTDVDNDTASTSITIDPGPAASLSFTTQPSNVYDHNPFPATVAVDALDGNGNLVTSFNKASTMTVSCNGVTGATTLGTNNGSFSGGKKTYPNLAVGGLTSTDPNPATCTLTDTAGGITGHSGSFQVRYCRITAVISGAPATAFPWDTLSLSASLQNGQTCGRTVSYSWTAPTKPGGTTGGFKSGAWPSFSGSASGTGATYYVTSTGQYVFQLTADDGVAPSTPTATVNVGGFTQATYATGTTTLPVIATGFKASTGDVLLATDDTALTAQIYQHATGKVTSLVALGCTGLTSPHGNAVRSMGGGEYLLGYSDTGTFDAVTVSGTGPTSCTSTAQAPPGSAGYSRVNDFVDATGGGAYLATDAGFFFYDFGNGNITIQSFGMGTAPTGGFSGIVHDANGNLWVGSTANNNCASTDGLCEAPDPPTSVTSSVNLTAGNDKMAHLVLGTGGVLWATTNGNGIFEVPISTQNPVVYATGGNGLPNSLSDTAYRGVTDSQGDVWIATANGIARWKTDVQAFVALPQGSFGLPAGKATYDVAIDETNGRRIVYVGTAAGLYLMQ